MSLRLCAISVVVSIVLSGCSILFVPEEMGVPAPSVEQASEPTTAVTPAGTAAPVATPTVSSTMLPSNPAATATPIPGQQMAPTLVFTATATPGPKLGAAAALTVPAEITGSLPSTATIAQPAAANLRSEDPLAAGRWLQSVGDCNGARQEFAELVGTGTLSTSTAEDKLSLSAEQAAEARYRLALCYLRDDAPAEANTVLSQLLSDIPAEGQYRAPATFLLGEAQLALGDWEGAETNYRTYLGLVPELSALSWQRIAAAREGAGDLAGAAEAYGEALKVSPDWTTTVAARRALAALALKRGDSAAAVAQYDLLRGTSTNGPWIAEMQWLAGSAINDAGDTAAAIERWQAAAAAAPKTKYAHLAMAALVEAGAPVDEFLRGLVNYYNGTYQLAVAAFDRYHATDSTGRQGEAWYYAGLSYLALGQYDRGLAELGNLIAAFPESPLWPDAWMSKARAQARAGDTAAAKATYRQFAQLRPDATQASQALWLAANLDADEGLLEAAADAYLALARRYPGADEGWRSYLAAGLTHFRMRDWRRAGDVWTEMATAQLPAWTRTVAYYWLGRAQAAAGELQAAQQSWEASWNADPSSFYGMRAADWAAQTGQPIREATPVPPGADVSVSENRAALEKWLTSWAGEGSLAMPAAIKADPDWRQGEALLAINRRSAALAAWSRLQTKHANDPWALSSLALSFADAGAYRLSIAAAEQVIALSPGANLKNAPLALQRLAYPLPYSDLVRTQAGRWGLDPRLVAAVIRQESRFETEAISVAAAQGLMQVIPSTADWIALQLGWRNFVPQQIYWPYVNVTFGTYYLQQALKDFDGSLAAALAAYNGGPGNAARWRKLAPEDDDLMVALVDLSETRLYVQLVWEQYDIYKRLYP